MIGTIAFSVILTTGILIVDIFSKNMRRWYIYGILFILFASIHFFTRPLEAYDLIQKSGIPSAQIEIEFYNLEGKPLTNEQRQHFRDKMRMHKENAERTYKDAKDKCWWLPRVDDRQKARYCFTEAIAALAPNTPHSKVVAVVITFLLNYGLDCLDEWEYIDNKLYWCHYHWEMAEFCQTVLDKGEQL